MSRAFRLLALPLLMLAWPGVTAERQLKDPTMPALLPSLAESAAAEVVSPAESLTLSLILLHPSRRVAVIDGQQVEEGSKVGTHRVLKIEPDKVLLDSGKTLFLFGPSVVSQTK